MPIRLDPAVVALDAQVGLIDLVIKLYPVGVFIMQVEASDGVPQHAGLRECPRALDAGWATVAGAIGKQKDLYTQQITSYLRDSELKAAKIFSDAWITQKTLDEGLTAPTNFTNATVDIVMSKIRTNNSLT